MNRVCAVALIAFAVATPALAAGTTRFHAPKLAVALRKQAAEQDDGGFYRGTTCSASGGSARTGWLHVTCVGMTNLEGEPHRYKAVYTPKGCTSESLDLTIYGAYDNGADYESKSSRPWRHDIFTC